MANKTISLTDKEIVIQRLAEGQSTRQSIQGTSIASNQTAARIAKAESHRIKRLRSDYVYCIEKHGAHIDKRSATLARMLDADQLVKLPIHPYLHRGEDFRYIFVPDWDTRLKAIKYIDQITGLMPMQGGMNINMLQQLKAE